MRDAVIVDAIRTPIGRRRGSLSNVHPVDLLGHVMQALLQRSQLNPSRVDDVIIGCVDQVGEQAANIARNAWLSAGLPESVPGTTIDRQCGSSLQALHFAAQGVMSGAYDIVIAGGVESMTRVPLLSTLAGNTGTPLTEDLKRRYDVRAVWFNQSVGAEMIAHQWGMSRRELDAFSLQSHVRAQNATDSGFFSNEMVSVPLVDTQGGAARLLRDEGIRKDTSLDKLSALAPAFEGLQLITAGNASQISDGASACLVMSQEMAETLGLRPRARFVSFAVVGVNPVSMLTGPIEATRKVLHKAGLTVEEMDLFEVNEAFASVVLAWQHETAAPWDRVNVNGGAIALGHPLGATGTRIVATLVNELERREAQYGLVAICEGGGMANATILERIP